jgi:hypothetical protein
MADDMRTGTLHPRHVFIILTIYSGVHRRTCFIGLIGFIYFHTFDIPTALSLAHFIDP